MVKAARKSSILRETHNQLSSTLTGWSADWARERSCTFTHAA